MKLQYKSGDSWKDIPPVSLEPYDHDVFMSEAWAASEARENAYREAHRDDPCTRCGAEQNVEIVPTGSLAKLTPLCVGCRELCAKTESWRAGYDAGIQAFKERSWWRRLFNH